MTKIKICGLTRAEDVALCAELGADFVGFVFVRESPRFVEAASLRVSASSSRRVGVFRDAALDDVHRTAEIARLDFVQLHGSEGEEYVSRVQLPVIKAFKVESSLPDTSTKADWVMFDSGGGTGRSFDWSLLDAYPRTKPFFLAGGLTADNVEEAIRRARPDAIDLSSGVESAPGIKDSRKLRDLFERVART